jgi:hypothetical protein
MGMYTEIYARGTLKRNTSQEVVDLLKAMTMDGPTPETLPDHELFKTERWEVLGCGASAYFPCTTSKLEVSDYSHQWSFMFHANLKNYGREIEKFFDWIDEYVEGSEGEFLGYELYEETEPGQSPRNYFKMSSNW